ncbi:MAG: helix-turn-helix domain-containing protein [Clostridiales bacterium]|nr:helix-turn-helix domain-containing protein [Clostridiales bacterium]
MSDELMMARIEDMEKRIEFLEQRLHSILWDNSTIKTEKELVNRYGEYVDKTQTAQILSVTRATVYAMLADGRIEGACEGKRVSVRSIARYLAAPKSKRRQGKKVAIHEG